MKGKPKQTLLDNVSWLFVSECYGQLHFYMYMYECS